jgi:2-polyprenyl-3-methyl-5-hydroxy-6-metoxy-1,4-benzoquinol methylase
MVGEFWNQMYDVEHYRYGTSPNVFLVEQSHRFAPGARVLCVGDGEGRNGVWLAQQGYDVVTVEASERGVGKARRLAADRGVLPDVRHGLFPHALAPEETFDAIVLIFVHVPTEGRHALHRAVVSRLRPGGHVLLEAFTPEQLGFNSGGPRDRSRMYTTELLAEDFQDLEIPLLERRDVVLDEGPGHSGLASVVRLVAVTRQ